VLFVGGWIDVKGARALVRIWPTVLASVPDASLTVAGAGVAVERVLASFPDNVRSRISVTAVESTDGMRRLYAEHDLLLMPSISEGSPLTLLEAAAAALPIVASRTGGIPDLVRDGTEALLYDPLRPDLASAHVILLLRDLSLREQLGAAAQRRAAEFTWLRTAEGLVDACRRAIVARDANAPADVRQPA
jgi:glycosyltransferase involved in cell wall biosynthesis